jgi:GNAT superfamily N-acetyltransferase
MTLTFRRAGSGDAPILSELNAALIRDEGHRNSMSVSELKSRMRSWLQGEYEAVLMESGGKAIGYALYRFEPDYVYLRQFFVSPSMRRQGIGRAAMAWLRENVWKDATRVRVEVLVGNAAGIAFWRAVGFDDYCLTLERAVTREVSETAG